MSGQQTVSILNKQNLKLAAIIDQPQAEGLHPAVLVVHGFTGFKEEEHLGAFAQGLAAAGFVALRFDASGFGESEGTIEKDYRVSNYLEDIEVAIDYLSKLPDVDSKRIGICGHSMGAGLCVITSAKNSKIKVCCAVQPSPITWTRGCNHNLEQWEKDGWLDIETAHPKYKQIRLPWEFAVDRNRYDAALSAAKIKIPLMVMYGTADSTVDPELTLPIFENAGGPKELVPLPGYDHDFKNHPAEVLHVTSQLVGFFKHVLG